MGSNGRYNKIISIKKMWSSKERCGFGFHDLLFFSFWISLSVRNYFFFVLLLVVLPLISQKSHIFFCWEEEETTGSDIPNILQHSHTHTEEETAKQQSTTFNSFYYSGLYIYYTNIQLIIYR